MARTRRRRQWGSRTAAAKRRWTGAGLGAAGLLLLIKVLPLGMWPLGVGLWLVWAGLGPVVVGGAMMWAGWRLWTAR